MKVSRKSWHYRYLAWLSSPEIVNGMTAPTSYWSAVVFGLLFSPIALILYGMDRFISFVEGFDERHKLEIVD
jgi:hypothetical protein